MIKVFVDTNFGVNPAKGHLGEDRDRKLMLPMKIIYKVRSECLT